MRRCWITTECTMFEISQSARDFGHRRDRRTLLYRASAKSDVRSHYRVVPPPKSSIKIARSFCVPALMTPSSNLRRFDPNFQTSTFTFDPQPRDRRARSLLRRRVELLRREICPRRLPLQLHVLLDGILRTEPRADPDRIGHSLTVVSGGGRRKKLRGGEVGESFHD